MVTVAHLVKKIVKEKPFLDEAISQRLISYGNLAEQFLPRIEQELGKKVKYSAIVMALRRYAEETEARQEGVKKFDYRSEIVMKTNICDFTVVKSPSFMAKLKSLYGLVDYARGDVLNVVLGNYEASIVISERHREKLQNFLKGEKIMSKENNLVSLSFRFSDDFFHTPGVIFTIIRKLAWENINIYEVVSTMTELTLIISKNDSKKAYDALNELIEGNN